MALTELCCGMLSPWRLFKHIENALTIHLQFFRFDLDTFWMVYGMRKLRAVLYGCTAGVGWSLWGSRSRK